MLGSNIICNWDKKYTNKLNSSGKDIMNYNKTSCYTMVLFFLFFGIACTQKTTKPQTMLDKAEEKIFPAPQIDFQTIKLPISEELMKTRLGKVVKLIYDRHLLDYDAKHILNLYLSANYSIYGEPQWALSTVSGQIVFNADDYLLRFSYKNNNWQCDYENTLESVIECMVKIGTIGLKLHVLAGANEETIQREFYYSIDSMLKHLHPRTEYIDPYKGRDNVFQEKATLGMYFGWVGNVKGITHIFKNSEAYKKGLRKGDEITRLNQTAKFSLEMLKNAMYGEANTNILLTIVNSKGEERTVELHYQDQKDFPSVLIDRHQDYLLLRIYKDAYRARREIEARLPVLFSDTSQIRGIVLDLRQVNWTASKFAPIIADLFIDKGVLLQSEYRGKKFMQNDNARPHTPFLNIPLAVIVDSSTSQWAERLAYILKINASGVLIGNELARDAYLLTKFQLNRQAGIWLVNLRVGLAFVYDNKNDKRYLINSSNGELQQLSYCIKDCDEHQCEVTRSPSSCGGDELISSEIEPDSPVYQHAIKALAEIQRR